MLNCISTVQQCLSHMFEGQLFNIQTEGLVYLVWQSLPQARLSRGLPEGAHSFPWTLELLYLAICGTKIQLVSAMLL